MLVVYEDDNRADSILIYPQSDAPYLTQIADDKLENSSGYGSEECFSGSDVELLRVRVEKDRAELGLVLKASSTSGEKGVEIKSVMVCYCFTK